MRQRIASRALALALATGGLANALAQTPPPNQPPAAQQQQQNATSSPPVYKPPLRGAPGGRVGGASRSPMRWPTPLPVVELLAPADHAGVTTSVSPTLYFYVSRLVSWPTQFTISAPMQPKPVVEVTIPSPPTAGIYAIHIGDYSVRLQPGVVYTWSVSVVLNPKAWAQNIVASASILSEPGRAVAAASLPPRRAAVLADSGLWYDAVAAAAEAQPYDQRAALNALLAQVGLAEPISHAEGTSNR